MSMKQKMKMLSCMICTFITSAILHAQDSGWTVNPHDYQYDMTVYAQIVSDGMPVEDCERYEIAALAGDECRGVSLVQMQNGKTWYYLRVRSNQATDETLVYKVYDKVDKRFLNVEEKLDFESNGLVGMPSTPTTLTLKKYTLGDVNDDGKINAIDIQRLVILVRSGESAADNMACDMDENGKLNSVDIQKLVLKVRQQ